MRTVSAYLDCGCAMLVAGGREWCPTCLASRSTIRAIGETCGCTQAETDALCDQLEDGSLSVTIPHLGGGGTVMSIAEFEEYKKTARQMYEVIVPGYGHPHLRAVGGRTGRAAVELPYQIELDTPFPAAGVRYEVVITRRDDG